jgi:hypothetical protein
MTAPDNPKCHADLKELSVKHRRPLHSMYALASRTDPYMAGQPFRAELAHWFAGLYNQLAIRFGVHVRAIFYKLVSQPDAVIRVNGKPFENTLECFIELNAACRDARYLDLIPADVIVDRRNPPPTINLDSRSDASAEIGTEPGDIERHEFGIYYEAPTLSLPEIDLTSEPRIGQRYHLEIWIEKSTANDILLPLGRYYGINIATFVGEVSSTACKNLVDRAIASGRPVRILYISDFDPGGRSMPVAAAVKIGFEAMKSGVDLDIRVEQVALTEEQCRKYELPRTPIKESEMRAAKFEARFGAGATELDALEAIHPGVLRQILVEHIDRYYDHGLDDDVEHAIEEFRANIEETRDEVLEDHADELERLAAERKEIDRVFGEVRDPAREAYDLAVAEAQRVFDGAIEGVRDRVTEMEALYIEQARPLLDQITEELRGAAPDPDQFDWPEPVDGDEWDDPLYDSTREYVEQVDRFREFQDKDSDVRLGRDRVVTKACQDCGKVFESISPKQRYCSDLCRRRAGGVQHASHGKQQDIGGARDG